jgi:hypothetical protein
MTSLTSMEVDKDCHCSERINRPGCGVARKGRGGATGGIRETGVGWLVGEGSSDGGVAADGCNRDKSARRRVAVEQVRQHRRVVIGVSSGG